jgi:hypothetical protein
MFEQPQIGMHAKLSVAAAFVRRCDAGKANGWGARDAESARVDRVDDPLIVGLPQREVPPPGLDT